MGQTCKEYEIEIAATASGDLDADVAAHVERCPGCAGLRADALRLTNEGGPSLSAEAAVAIARSAVRDGPRRRPLLWIAPLLSASASAAALILYFGLAATPADTPDSPAGESAITNLPRLTDMPLPESFEASHDLLFTHTTTEDES